MANFKAFNIKKDLLYALNSLGYENATDIQNLVLPKALAGNSLVVKSETGSGKTHCFIIPILNNIDENEHSLQAIIISPTRELAEQTYSFFKDFSKFYPTINIKLISSSEQNTTSIEKLKTKPQIIVATCGRLKNLLDESIISLSSCKVIVLDEADMILESGFIEDADAIISKLTNPQIMVFSATITESLQNILSKYISSDFYITSDNSDFTSKNVKHFAIDTRHVPLNEATLLFLKFHPCYFILIFVSEKKDIDSLHSFLVKKGYKCAKYHGDLLPRERKSIMKRIRNDEYQVVVCSDVASRGLDLPACDTVLSLDLPNNLEFYFHRAGRTGRYNKTGESYIFYDNDHYDKLKKLISQGLKVEFLKIGRDSLLPGKFIDEKRNFKNKANPELEKEIKKAKASVHSKQVKPGYKKKIKEAIAKAKSKYRREFIKKDIRRQRVERYKKEHIKDGE
jgi:ATP-dependent RNA helicase CshB